MISTTAVSLSVLLFLIAAGEQILFGGNFRLGVLYFFIAGTNACVLWAGAGG